MCWLVLTSCAKDWICPKFRLVAILDADKEGFLRSERSLTQTAGRAARNINGKVIMYADKITDSMQRTIDETNRRREKQIKYNIENNITPTQIVKSTDSMMKQIIGEEMPDKKNPVPISKMKAQVLLPTL